MKKNTSHIIIAVMVLITSAPFLLPGMLVLQKAVIVHEMTEKLERNELQEIRMERSRIQWIRKNKELWVGDRMFDVKELREDGPELVITGLFDDDEKRIIAKMGTLSTPAPFEKERSATIYQLTHLETDLVAYCESDRTPGIFTIYPASTMSTLRGIRVPHFDPPDQA